ncbi:MAG: stage III sporulation protein AF [Clostridia bacterium]|nr:stage III sporulation protein AF [Clostridia bacterium]
MKEYLLTLMGVALLNGIVGMLSPEGGLKKYVRLVGALCLICAIAQPIFSFLSETDWRLDGLWQGEDTDTSESYEALYEDMLLSGSERYAAERLKGEIARKFNLGEDSFEVTVRGGEEKASVTVTLRDAAIFADPKEIISYIQESYGCDCTVIYD